MEMPLKIWLRSPKIPEGSPNMLGLHVTMKNLNKMPNVWMVVFALRFSDPTSVNVPKIILVPNVKKVSNLSFINQRFYKTQSPHMIIFLSFCFWLYYVSRNIFIDLWFECKLISSSFLFPLFYYIPIFMGFLFHNWVYVPKVRLYNKVDRVDMVHNIFNGIQFFV